MSSEVLKKLIADGVKYISFCFTDISGVAHAITYCAEQVSPNVEKSGIAFDGSSIYGWKEIHKSDTLLIPDFSSYYIDPFTSEPCARVFCDVYDTKDKMPYNRDPRGIARRAMKLLSESKIASHAYFGPELEFFVFDGVSFHTSPYGSAHHIEAHENPANNSKQNSEDYLNPSHRPAMKGGYFPMQPLDSLFDLRAEICEVLREIGMKPTLHHHEVAPNQCEVGFLFDEMVRCADNVQRAKYVIKNVAASYSKTATFMPKPIWQDNGSGMHVHQSLWGDKSTLFYDENGYAHLSELALYYMGGIIKHAKAINAFTNPTTNSYKRLVPGYEAPINLAYSANNRSVAIRVPYSDAKNATRIEVRFPDPTANPYLAFSAMLMAGIDGIINKIHPGSAIDEDVYHLPKEALKNIPNVAESLEDAIRALDNDREFLKRGGVFSDDFIDTYVDIKLKESKKVSMVPTPLEFELYYSS